jgi:exocyst complex component 1
LKENTPTVTDEVTSDNGPTTEAAVKREIKVTVEKDLVSQAEEEDMESLLDT